MGLSPSCSWACLRTPVPCPFCSCNSVTSFERKKLNGSSFVFLSRERWDKPEAGALGGSRETRGAGCSARSSLLDRAGWPGSGCCQRNEAALPSLLGAVLFRPLAPVPELSQGYFPSGEVANCFLGGMKPGISYSVILLMSLSKLFS